MPLARRVLVAAAACLLAAVPARADTYQPQLLDLPPIDGTFAFHGASDDLSRLVFGTAAPIDAGDTDDGSVDLFRFDGATAWLSQGSNDPRAVTFAGRSRDALRVFFETDLALVEADDDAATDVYEHADGRVRLLSATTAGLNMPAAATYRGATPDGTSVYFETEARMASEDDAPSDVDVYERHGEITTLISRPDRTSMPDRGDATFLGVSDDGSRAWFETYVSMEPETDRDGGADVYERRRDGDTRHVSLGNGPDAPTWERATPDGEALVLRTQESLDPSADTDGGAADLYVVRAGQAPLLASTGPSDDALTFPSGGTSLAIGADGRRLVFETALRLSPEDADHDADLYIRDTVDGTTRLVTGARQQSFTFHAASADAARVVLSTPDALLPADTDAAADAYRFDGSAFELLTPGTAAPVQVRAVRDDLRSVFFETSDALVPEDADAQAVDVYRSRDATTSLVSHSANASGHGAGLLWADADGLGAMFRTAEALTPADIDAGDDIYVSRPVPAQAGSGAAAALAGPQPVDRTGPRIRSVRVARARLAAATRGGLRVIVDCGEPCRLGAQLALDARTARRIRLARRRTVVATGATPIHAATRPLVRIRFKSRARSRLLRLKRVRLALRLTASDAAGNRTHVVRRVVLRR